VQERRIDAVFEGFDSIDPRTERWPKDLPQDKSGQNSLFV
jgi:hypothetical protein